MEYEVQPALPMTTAEHEFLIGDGSLGGAIAGHQLRFVYCRCGRDFPADEWRDHPRAYPGARYLDDNGPHEAWAFERPADWVNDCMVFLDRPDD